ncbi:DUF58 domain-containing protein [Simiduia litorea]
MLASPLINTDRISQFWRTRFHAWIKRRILPARQIQLGQRNLFIFPSLSGLAFLLLLALLWVMGTNYENTLILGFMFLLLSVFVLGILHTYNNMAGLVLSLGDVQPVFAGENADFRVRVRQKPGLNKGVALELNWQNESLNHLTLSQVEAEVSLWSACLKRGWHRPGRLRVQSVFPLGILRCWTWLDLAAKVLVYPVPIATDRAPWQSAEGELDAHFQTSGSDDFIGLESYQPGHSLRRISWKHYARGQGLMLKEFADPQGQAQALDWAFFAGMDVENRLSRLCYWVIFLHRKGLPFSLKLPGVTIDMGQGDDHRNRCLYALAVFGQDDLC